MPSSSHNPSTTVEARVTSKGQVTLPKELRKRLGMQSRHPGGSRTRHARGSRQRGKRWLMGH